MAFIHAERRRTPYAVIGALLAWNISDLSKPPPFILGRSKNMEMMGEVFHAESEVIRAAYASTALNQALARSPGDMHAKDRRAAYSGVLSETTLFTTLDPCPMCVGTALLARIPRVIHGLDDSGIRFRDGRYSASIPLSVYGRSITIERSDLEVVTTLNEKMWAQSDADGPRFEVINFLIDAIEGGIYSAAHQQLLDIAPMNPVNSLLRDRLLNAIGPEPDKS